MTQTAAELGGKVEEHALLAQYTTLRIGGPADFLCHITLIEEALLCLRAAKTHGIPLFVLGAGSNTLIADAGVRGIVLLMENATWEVLDERRVRVGAGLRLGQLVVKCADAGKTGIEWLAGIPGTVGGALYGNAGSTTVGLGEKTESIRVLKDDTIVSLPRATCAFGYRTSRFKSTHEIIIDAILVLAAEDPSAIRGRIAETIAKKNAHQPTAASSAGCMFKNPPGQSAGKLIDTCGLKGKRIGNVQISEKHGNFFVNLGGATAEEVVLLLSFVKQRVRDQTGIQLTEEVQYLGF